MKKSKHLTPAWFDHKEKMESKKSDPSLAHPTGFYPVPRTSLVRMNRGVRPNTQMVRSYGAHKTNPPHLEGYKESRGR